MRAIFAWLCCLVTAPLAAQQAAYTYLDQRPPYSNQTFLTALNLPKLGATFQVMVPYSQSTCCPFQKNYYLATGTANPSLRFDPLGGYLFTNADLSVVQTFTNSSGGSQTLSFQISSSPALIGVFFCEQVLEHAWNSFWTTVVLSRGGMGMIGS